MLKSILQIVAAWFGAGLHFAPVRSSDDVWIDEVTPGWVMHDLMRVQRTRGCPAAIGVAAVPPQTRPVQMTPAGPRGDRGCVPEQAAIGQIPSRNELRARNR